MRQIRPSVFGTVSALLAILALLASGLAAPLALAASLSGVDLSLSNPLAGASGTTYTVSFTATTSQSLDRVTVSVPGGTSGTPTGVTMVGSAAGTINYPIDTVTLSGGVITVSLSSRTSTPAGTVVTLTIPGITNTATSGDHTSTLTTMSGGTIVDSGTTPTYSITSPASASPTPTPTPTPSVTPTPTPTPTPSASASPTSTALGASLSGVGLSLSNRRAGATGTTYTVRFTTASGERLDGVRLTVPAGTSGTPTGVTMVGSAAGTINYPIDTVTRSGGVITVSLSSPTSTPAGTVVTLTIPGITNTLTSDDYTSTVTTMSGGTIVNSGTTPSFTITPRLAAPLAAPLVLAAALSGVDLSLSNPLASATGTTYTVSFTASTSQNLDRVTLSVPAGTSGTPTGVTMVGLAPYTINYPIGTVTLSGGLITVPFSSQTYTPAGTVVTLTIPGITNTATSGDYTSTLTTFMTGGTIVDSGTTPTYSIISTALTATNWWPSSVTTSATGVTYTFQFTTTTTATLTSVAISGITGLGGTPTLTSVSGLPNGGTVARSGGVLSYSFTGTSVASGTAVTLVVGGLTNPSVAANYSPLIVTRAGSTSVDGAVAGPVAFAGNTMTNGSWTASSLVRSETGVSYTFGFRNVTGGNLNTVRFQLPLGATAPSLAVGSLTIDPGYSYTPTGIGASYSNGRITLTFTAPGNYVQPNSLWSVTFTGITNPPVVGTYGAPIVAFIGSTPTDVLMPPTLSFTAPSAAFTGVSWAPSSATAGASGVRYAYTVTTPSVLTMTSITMSVPVGTTGTPSVGSVLPALISGGTASRSGTTLTYSFASTTLASGTPIAIELTGLTNTGTAQTIASTVTGYDSATVVAAGTSNAVTFAAGALGSPAWSANSTTVGSTGVSYTYGFRIASRLTATKFTMTLPPGTSGTPSLTSATTTIGGPITGGSVSRSGTTLTVSFTSVFLETDSVITVVVGGLTNTSTPGSYASVISTFNGITPYDSGTAPAVAFTDVAMTGVSWTPSKSAVGATGVTYAYSFGLSATATVDAVTMTVPSGTGGSPTVGSVTPGALAGGSVSLSGTTLTYTFPSPQSISNVATVNIAIGGLTNTSSVGTYATTVAAKRSGSAVASGTSSGVGFSAGAFVNPSWGTSSQATSTAATYTYGFTTPAAGTSYSSFTFAVPSGTTGTPALGTISAHDQFGAVTFAGTGVSLSGTTVTFSFTTKFLQPSTTVSVEVTGLTNTPTAGSYSSTITGYNGASPLTSGATSPIAFSANALDAATWTTSSAAIGATGVTYTYGFSLSATAPVSSLTMTVPAGTGGTLSLGTVTPAAVAGGSLTRSGDTLTYSFSQVTLSPDQLVTITVNGVTNTSTGGTYSSTFTVYDNASAIVAAGSSTSISLDASTLSAVSWTLSSGLTGHSNTQYTWHFTTATANTLNQVTMTVPTGTTGTPTLVSASTTPAVTLAGAAVALSGTTLTLSFTGVNVPAGTAFSVVVDGITNTLTVGDYSSSIVTRSSGTPRDSGITGTVRLDHPHPTVLAWTLAGNVAGTPNVLQGFAFQTQTTASLDSIVISLPPGTTGTPTIGSIAPASISHGTSASLTGDVLQIAFDAAVVPAATQITLQINGLTLTPTPGSYVVVAQTRSGGDFVDSAESDPTSIVARTLTATISCAPAAGGCSASGGGTAVTLVLIPGAATPVYGGVSLAVSTNAPFGYAVNVASTELRSGSNLLLQASLSGEPTVVADRFGASAQLTSGGVSSPQLCGAYAGASPLIGYDTSPLSLWSAAAGTGGSTDQVVLTNRLRVSTVQPAGVYTGTITYGVVPRYTAAGGC